MNAQMTPVSTQMAIPTALPPGLIAQSLNTATPFGTFPTQVNNPVVSQDVITLAGEAFQQVTGMTIQDVRASANLHTAAFNAVAKALAAAMRDPRFSNLPLETQKSSVLAYTQDVHKAMATAQALSCATQNQNTGAQALMNYSMGQANPVFANITARNFPGNQLPAMPAAAYYGTVTPTQPGQYLAH